MYANNREAGQVPVDAENYIITKGLDVVFAGSDGTETKALSDVSIHVRKGEFVSLLGPSGCGKTTLLRVIADLVAPTSGIVSVFGREPEENRMARKYGMVFQSPVLYEWRKVRENVMLPLEIMGLPKAERLARADETLELVGLSKFARHYPWQLSGGMQQRVGIARALAIRPELLLMDEPFSALDEFTREKLNEDLLEIWSKTGKTVVFVTHSIQEAVFLSDRVFVMSPRPGRLSSVETIGLPRPRGEATRSSAEFVSTVSRIKKAFEETYRSS